jgi:ABC-type dipeptide/oligopeptide/nickel transport system permease component
MVAEPRDIVEANNIPPCRLQVIGVECFGAQNVVPLSIAESLLLADTVGLSTLMRSTSPAVALGLAMSSMIYRGTRGNMIQYSGTDPVSARSSDSAMDRGTIHNHVLHLMVAEPRDIVEANNIPHVGSRSLE